MEVLRVGSRGPDVELLQTALRRAGAFQGAADGVFGAVTERAVMDFQSRHGLASDGVAGPLTWNALHPWLTGYIRHTVQAGDTLFALARRYDTTVRAIQTANPGAAAENLQIGTPITVPLPFDVVPSGIRFTSHLLAFCVEGLAARYPFIRVSGIGSSVLGKTLHTLAIGEGRNEVLYNASHHANEWITTPVLMRFAELYAASRAGLDLTMLSPVAAEMYAKTTIYLVPMVNPDGVDLVTGAIAPGSAVYETARAMNYLRLPFPSGWKANIRGVDLNVNYPATWETAREIKFAQGYVLPGPRDFVGERPLSEPESQAMAAFTRSRDFSLTLSYHTQGEVIYWRYLNFLPPRSEEIVRLLSRVSGYAYEDTPFASGHAGYKDWFIQEYNRPGYTIECGLGISPLPVSQFGRIFRDNIGILTLPALL
ncbi:MAG: M14 family metallopeptidase [Oscillospiraceae bacterium]|nr:M14 family metallopeptidase [Oscillospiraceae bacterium]